LGQLILNVPQNSFSPQKFAAQQKMLGLRALCHEQWETKSHVFHLPLVMNAAQSVLVMNAAQSTVRYDLPMLCARADAKALVLWSARALSNAAGFRELVRGGAVFALQ
jgi:hypothetical protein